MFHLLVPGVRPFAVPPRHSLLSPQNPTMSTPIPSPDLHASLQQQGRLPQLGDSPSPWHYRGWLLPYVIRLHALVPAVADRWGYHLRTLEAGQLLDEPIPQIRFGEPNPRV